MSRHNLFRALLFILLFQQDLFSLFLSSHAQQQVECLILPQRRIEFVPTNYEIHDNTHSLYPPHKLYNYFAVALEEKAIGLVRNAKLTYSIGLVHENNHMTTTSVVSARSSSNSTTTSLLASQILPNSIESLFPNEGPFYFALFPEDLWIFLDSARFNQKSGMQAFVCDLPVVKRVPLRDASEWTGTLDLAYVSIDSSDFYGENQYDRLVPVIMKCDSSTTDTVQFTSQLQYVNPNPMAHLSLDQYSLLFVSTMMLVLWVLFLVCALCATIIMCLMGVALGKILHMMKGESTRDSTHYYQPIILPTDAPQVYDDNLPLDPLDVAEDRDGFNRKSDSPFQGERHSGWTTFSLILVHIIIAISKFAADVYLLSEARESGDFTETHERVKNVMTSLFTLSFVCLLIWIASGHHATRSIQHVSIQQVLCVGLMIGTCFVTQLSASLCLESSTHNACYSVHSLSLGILLLVYFSIYTLIGSTILYLDQRALTTIFIVQRQRAYRSMRRYQIFQYIYAVYICAPAVSTFLNYTFLSSNTLWFTDALIKLLHLLLVVIISVVFRPKMATTHQKRVAAGRRRGRRMSDVEL